MLAERNSVKNKLFPRRHHKQQIKLKKNAIWNNKL